MIHSFDFPVGWPLPLHLCTIIYREECEESEEDISGSVVVAAAICRRCRCMHKTWQDDKTLLCQSSSWYEPITGVSRLTRSCQVFRRMHAEHSLNLLNSVCALSVLWKNSSRWLMLRGQFTYIQLSFCLNTMYSFSKDACRAVRNLSLVVNQGVCLPKLAKHIEQFISLITIRRHGFIRYSAWTEGLHDESPGSKTYWFGAALSDIIQKDREQPCIYYLRPYFPMHPLPSNANIREQVRWEHSRLSRRYQRRGNVQNRVALNWMKLFRGGRRMQEDIPTTSR